MKTRLCLTLLAVSPGQSFAADNTGIAFFESKIRPALIDHCYRCHSTESGKTKGGLKLDTREALLRGGENGPAIVPGSSARSLLFNAITHSDSEMEMPPKGKLSPQIIEDFRRWIDMGAPDPREGESGLTVQSQVDVEAGRQWWAYRQPTKPEVPVPLGSSWARTDIDRFVLARLERNQLTPAKDADPRVLVRRLYFVLTGLPPSSADVERWTNRVGPSLDQSAVSDLVDQLLRTPRFGERWGRHWLDVARFAESTGGDSNNIHRYAWRYRDYVIDAFNADKPFNRFILEQIAGDLLPISNHQEWANNLVATGFLAIGQKLVGDEDQRKFFAEFIDEQIDATTRAFLATTVTCARCHDHKFDPIPQTDYYALAGIFRSTKIHYGLIKAQARQWSTLLDVTGMGLPTMKKPLNATEFAQLKRERDEAHRAMGGVMTDIRGGSGATRARLRRSRTQRDQAEAALQAYDSRGYPRVFAMGAQDREYPMTTHVLVRGDIEKRGSVIQRGFVQVLSRSGQSGLPRTVRGSGRLQLAEWLASDENPITGRVIVNRVWQWLYGRALIRTVDDFGRSGEQPSHPELLDHLTICLRDNGWSLKSLIREIVLSRTWQQSSQYDVSNHAADPDNRYLWRMNPRRLEAEAIRDAMLAVSGNLNSDRPLGTLLGDVGEGAVGQVVFEPVIRKMDFNHRSVYLPRVRSVLPEMLDLFDAPDASLVTGARETTTVPLQALYTLNNEFVQWQADDLSRRVANQPVDQQIDHAYLSVFGRPPTAVEKAAADRFFDTFGAGSLAAYCQALMCTAEFGIID